MGCHNFEDEVLIKKQWASQKMNVMDGKLKDKKNRIIIETYFCLLSEAMCFQSSKIHISMNAKTTIEKLQRVVREKETQKSEHRRK